MLPRFPVYIVSKGRADTRLTSKALELCNVSYHIVIEPQEYDAYAAVIDPKKILTLPFSNLGLGSIPARNWIWEHSIQAGHSRHWILDDNINTFFRLYKNKRMPMRTGTNFFVIEEFVERYSNIALAGMQYRGFAPRRQKQPPIIPNTRIYSCILIDNTLKLRWRGRYNEDTDLSLRVLKLGLCTVLFKQWLCGKVPTLSMKGGNTDELYQGDGRLKMAQSLVEQHPDVTTITWRWKRYQHLVDYTPFKSNKFKLKPNVVIPTDDNEYGMVVHA
jgi:hypothetical protein